MIILVQKPEFMGYNLTIWLNFINMYGHKTVTLQPKYSLINISLYDKKRFRKHVTFIW